MSFDPQDFLQPKKHIDHDGYLVMYLPDSDLNGLQRFHFVVKRTCLYAPHEKAVPTSRQRPIFMSDQYYEDGDPYATAVRFENDLCPPKGATDVVVNGNCYPPDGEATHCYPQVKIGRKKHRLIVLGDRVAVIRKGEKPELSLPQKFTVMPMRYEFAYGGVDTDWGDAPIMNTANPLGVGYLVAATKDQEATDRAVVMPNIEDPDNLLDRDNLLQAPEKDTPLRAPAGFGWVPRSWQPRAAYAGMPESTRDMYLVLHGDADPEGENFIAMKPEFWRGAPAAMQFKTLAGNERVDVMHMHPKHKEMSFRLPDLQPKLRVSINGDEAEVPLALDTVQVEMELSEVSLVWRGSIPRPDTLESLADLERVLLYVDGELTMPAPLLGTGFPIELLEGKLPVEIDLSALDQLDGLLK